MVEKNRGTGEVIFSASTQGVPRHKKIDYWAEMLARIWGQIQIEPTDRNLFAGSIRSVRASSLKFNEVHYRGHNIHRTSSNIAMMKEDFYVLAFPSGEPWQMRLQNETFTLRRGNAYLLCNTVPYKSADSKGYDTFNVIIPSQMLRNLVPTLEPRYTFPLDGEDNKARILQSFIHSLYSHLPFSREDDTRLMEEHVLNLLSFLLKDKSKSIDVNDSSVKMAHRERILHYISQNYSDEFLSPESIALRHRISVSYLHRVFKPCGKTVVEAIREKRLQAAKRLLGSTRLAGLSVTEIAYRVGFKHPSDFSRAYKSRYGMTPKQARESASTD